MISKPLLCNKCIRYRSYAVTACVIAALTAVALMIFANHSIGKVPNHLILIFNAIDVTLMVCFCFLVIFGPYKKLGRMLSEDKTGLAQRHEDSFAINGSYLEEIAIDERNIIVWKTCLFFATNTIWVMVAHWGMHIF